MYHEAAAIPPPDYTFTVSARSKQPNVPVFQFLPRHFGHLPFNRIESLFGLVEYSPLYGGRVFHGRELSERDVFQLNNAGIGLRLPLVWAHYRHRHDAFRGARLGKLLSFVQLAVIAWFAWRAWRRLAAGAAERGPRAAEDMVRCAQCGVHLPRSEGVAAGGDFFCSEEHRRLRR